MIELGISIYPEHSTQEKDFAYMELASSYGFTKVFTCLLSVRKDAASIKAMYQAYAEKAHALGLQFIVDASPDVLSHIGAKPYDLSVVREIGFDCIRLDMSFGPLFDGMITQNKEGIEIAFNGSNDAGVELLLEHGARKSSMSICHNFFPQPFTALDNEKFRKLNQKWQRLALPITAFISSNAKQSFGPWPVEYGLCTREEDRCLPISTQLRHMMLEGNVNTCMIGNAYAEERELAACASLMKKEPMFHLVDVPTLSDVEKSILAKLSHQGRFDCGDHMIRSVFPRLLFAKENVVARSCPQTEFQRGDVLIVNENLKHYQAEVQIVLKPTKNLGYHNYVGHLDPLDLPYIALYKEEQPFRFMMTSVNS